MSDADDALYIEFYPPDPDLTYRHYLRTGEMLGVEPVSRDRAFGLIAEWTDVLSGRPETDGRIKDRPGANLRIVIVVVIALVGLVAFFVFVSPPYDHEHQATHNVSTSKRGDNVTVYHGIDIGAIQRTGNVSVRYLGGIPRHQEQLSISLRKYQGAQ